MKAASIPGWNQIGTYMELALNLLNISAGATCSGAGSGANVGADCSGGQRTYSFMEKPAGSPEANK